MPDAVIGVEFDGASLPRHLAAFKDGMAVGQGNQAFDVLVDDQDGLAAYQKILAQSKLLVSDKFMILLEIGYKQGQAVSHLAQETYPQARVKIWTDLAGLDRLVSVVV